MCKVVNKKIVYLGFNSFKTHKRGIENVIHFQSKASFSTFNYYIHWDTKTSVYSYDNFICIGIKKTFFWFISLNYILYRIKNRGEGIFIHSHNGLMSIFSIYQSNLFTVHDAMYYHMKVTKHWINKIFYPLEKILYIRTLYVHFISNYAKKMSLFSGNNNWNVIPNTSHLEIIKEKKLNTSAVLKTFSTGATKVFIVRSIEDRARIDLIIEVADYLKEKNYEFMVAGKGPKLDFYRDKIASLNLRNINLLGYVSDEDLIQYYQDAEIVMVPAEYAEGFGLPIIEGYLFDKVVVASNRCAIPDVICSKDFLFENTLESIVTKLDYAKGKLKQNYKEYYDCNYSNSIVIKLVQQLYKSII